MVVLLANGTPAKALELEYEYVTRCLNLWFFENQQSRLFHFVNSHVSGLVIAL